MAFVRKWREGREEASSSRMSFHDIKEYLNIVNWNTNGQVECNFSQRKVNPLEGEKIQC